jgi:ArsR family transcriptional regulator
MSSPLEDKFCQASRILKALGHSLRLELVCGLRHQPSTQTFIADKLGLPQSTVAQHLKVLRAEGLIKSERNGVEVMFSLADPMVTQILDTLCAKTGSDKDSVYSWEEIATLENIRRSTPGL